MTVLGLVELLDELAVLAGNVGLGESETETDVLKPLTTVGDQTIRLAVNNLWANQIAALTFRACDVISAGLAGGVLL